MKFVYLRKMRNNFENFLSKKYFLLDDYVFNIMIRYIY